VYRFDSIPGHFSLWWRWACFLLLSSGRLTLASFISI
jgi:hypothetical protein